MGVIERVGTRPAASKVARTSPPPVLPLDTLLTRQEMVDLDYTLQFVDPTSALYAGRRYKHFGVVVITVGAFIGQPGAGAVRLEHLEPDKFISFAVECNHSALPVLSTTGKKAIDNLVDQAKGLQTLRRDTHGFGRFRCLFGALPEN